ncbi:MAG: DNA adenine methylase [Dehalococcoidia bacterium]
MGSKASMLGNGLGDLIVENSSAADRVVDLFAGSGAISWFSAQMTDRPVLAIDLQAYAMILARSVISRTTAINARRLETSWLDTADAARRASQAWTSWPQRNGKLRKKDVLEARRVCSSEYRGVTWSVYGGHYFSPRQAETIDSLLKHLPIRDPHRTVCHAATILAASRCAASPGHTAQPFSPTPGGLIAIHDAWKVDPLEAARSALRSLATRFARRRGLARVADAVTAAAELRESDLVIVDPPYSDVQYSRFYHVLETVATGATFEATGAGRYPPFESRPRSDFSLVSQSANAFGELLKHLSQAGARTILTFPSGNSSNGLSGNAVTELAAEFFTIEARRIESRFSTLGGNHDGRPPRKGTEELILVLSPRDRV